MELPNVKKFLDANGVNYLASLLDNYPDNEILGTVITAIQEALDEKADNEHTHLTYLLKAGDTLTGQLITAAGSSNGIKFKNTGAYPDITIYANTGWHDSSYDDDYPRLYFSGKNNSGKVLLGNLLDPKVTSDAATKNYVDNKNTIKTTTGSNNTEYNLIGTLTTNNNTSAVNIYQPGLISFTKTNSSLGRLTIGNTTNRGCIRLYGDPNNGSGYIDLISNAESQSAVELELPIQSGTLALTTDIPNVPSWALSATKPIYTASEVGATTSSEVSSMIASAVSGITSFSTEIVSTLPSTGVTGRIYFKTGDSNTNDIYEEYIYVNNAWEKLGNFDATNIDLSGYLLKTDIAAWAKASTKPTYTASEVGALASNTQYVKTFNGQSGAITYIPPVTSVNGQTGAVTIATYDDTALAARVTALENIPWVTYYTGSSAPSNSQGNNGDLYLQT